MKDLKGLKEFRERISCYDRHLSVDIVAVRRRIVAVRRRTVVERPGIVADLLELSPKNEGIVADRRESSPKDEGMGLVAVRRMVFRVSEREAIVYRRHPFLKRKRQGPYKEARWERGGRPVAVIRQKRKKKEESPSWTKKGDPSVFVSKFAFLCY